MNKKDKIIDALLEYQDKMNEAFLTETGIEVIPDSDTESPHYKVATTLDLIRHIRKNEVVYKVQATLII